MTRRTRAVLASVGLAVLAVILPARPAAAAQTVPRHPLGNFSVNQYLGFRLAPDRVEATAIVDYAEIPTLQNRPSVDTNGDGTADDRERTAHAARICQDVGAAIRATVGDVRLVWTVARSEFTYSPGAGGLDVSRLGCALVAPALLNGPATVLVSNVFLPDRVGWREMTAAGQGLRLLESTLPARSVSDELRSYPQDLLSSVPDVRSATLRVEPGSGGAGGPDGALVRPGGDPISRWMAAVDRRFQDLAGGPHLTPAIGLLAVLLALLLGAGHAALPGHGKTVLAAYLAGQQGRPRDALAVAGTVTLTHTGGVLVLGLLLTAGTALAGEEILDYLGLASGAIVLVVGTGMLAGVLRQRRRNNAHDHDHAGHDHDHAGHDHGHAGHGRHTHDHHPAGHDHDHAGHGGPGTGGRRRLGLAGIGLAGGLVPSPSALVVLLAAIGLGRTGFGVLLVVSYGVGMAATLCGAGLLLLAVQRRLARTAAGSLRTRLSRLTARLQAATPATTAALVILVGMGLAARAAASVL